MPLQKRSRNICHVVHHWKPDSTSAVLRSLSFLYSAHDAATQELFWEVWANHAFQRLMTDMLFRPVLVDLPVDFQPETSYAATRNPSKPTEPPGTAKDDSQYVGLVPLERAKPMVFLDGEYLQPPSLVDLFIKPPVLVRKICAFSPSWIKPHAIGQRIRSG